MNEKEKGFCEELAALADALLSFRVSAPHHTAADGGVLCPACLLMHGRIADAVYPLLCLYEYTKDEKYREAARDFAEWTERNCLMPDGSYRNDAANGWEGVTAFCCIAFLKSLLYCPSALDEELQKTLSAVAARILRMLDGFMSRVMPVINYRAASAYAYALGYRYFGEEKYLAAARKWEQNCRGYVTENGLLRGEGTPCDYRSKRGYVPIDIAYNAEETLPSLLWFARETDDTEAEAFWQRCAETHIEFMLPDGAWDDSFGSRRFKWTYYGSRTADGCATGFFARSASAVLSEAARRNTALVRNCTHDGLVTGGKMFFEAGEPTCIHHTFCRMKGLADRLKFGENPESVPLYRDFAEGVKHYPEMGVYCVGKGNMYGSFAATDVRYGADCVGNALTLAYHKKIGALLSASMSDYTLIEPQNMQLSRKYDLKKCSTVRLEKDGFDSVRDTEAVLTCEKEDREGTILRSTGFLKNRDGKALARFALTYAVRDNGIEITAECEEDARLIFPIIASHNETVRAEEKCAEIKRSDGNISVEASEKIKCAESERIFNPVGGFLYAVFSAAVSQDKPLHVRITAEK